MPRHRAPDRSISARSSTVATSPSWPFTVFTSTMLRFRPILEMGGGGSTYASIYEAAKQKSRACACFKCGSLLTHAADLTGLSSFSWARTQASV